ncbi:MAG: AraC family transcriptional regulator [Erythrobacter sp.]|uniref:AraC family transcriptional regulator n=1 Tax=Erythrobacter sp. TaxID=1042 RepID=UPI003A8AE04B
MTIAVRCLAATYRDGYHHKPHSHVWGQLIYASSGLMRVRAGAMQLIVPPARGVWTPAGVEHEITAIGDFAMRTLYFVEHPDRELPNECCAIDVSPLLRELVLELVERCPVQESDASSMRLAMAAVECIANAPRLPLNLPLPRDLRAARLAVLLQDDPGSQASLSELARIAGASSRTMQRLFMAETGMPFEQWRRRLRLLHGAAMLTQGYSVTEAGFGAGYSSISAFTAAFRKQFGTPPSKFT